RVQWAAVGLGVLWVVWLLAPILSPFVFSALLGWLGDPMVDRLEARGLKRNTAVLLVFSAMTLLLVVAAILLVPVLEQQIVTLVESLPRSRDWFVQVSLPW
ncbi:AI-2E family transporter, partial [Bacillus cereus]